jgi:hypothetical protein
MVVTLPADAVRVQWPGNDISKKRDGGGASADKRADPHASQPWLDSVPAQRAIRPRPESYQSGVDQLGIPAGQAVGFTGLFNFNPVINGAPV